MKQLDQEIIEYPYLEIPSFSSYGISCTRCDFRIPMRSPGSRTSFYLIGPAAIIRKSTKLEAQPRMAAGRIDCLAVDRPLSPGQKRAVESELNWPQRPIML